MSVNRNVTVPRGSPARPDDPTRACAGLVLAVAWPPTLSHPGSPGELVLWDARLVDGTGSPPRETVAVTLRDGRVVADRRGAGGRRPGAPIDLDGRTLLPGLIDAHVHLAERRRPRRRASGRRGRCTASCRAHASSATTSSRRPPQALLEAGVTTVRDVGSMDDEAIGAPRGGRARRPRRPAHPDVRANRLRDVARRPDLRDDVPRGRRPGRLRKAVREQLRRGRRLRQGDGDGRALGRARGPRAGAAHPGGAWRAGRRGAPPRGSRGGARRGPRRVPGWRSRRASTPSSTASRCTASRRSSPRWPSAASFSCRP